MSETGKPTVLIVMGVSGSGKSTVGRALARRLGWRYIEGDDYHPAANVAKMARGEPLDDSDRAPWLARLAALIGRHIERGEPAVLAASLLKRAYRDRILDDNPGARLVYLDGEFPLILDRLRVRDDHFFPPTLLQSQFDTLEPPAPDEEAIVVPIDQEPDEIVDGIVGALDGVVQ